jgi:hypothetical protein
MGNHPEEIFGQRLCSHPSTSREQVEKLDQTVRHLFSYIIIILFHTSFKLL